MDFLDSPEQVLSTLNRDGSRRWLRPRLSPGRFVSARRGVAYLLIVIFMAIPHLSLAGKPLMLLDLPARRFTIFGFTFLPSDTLLLALFMVMVIVSIFLVTALLGRVWCGWMCPQTVYMEFLYRPLERLFDGSPNARGQATRKPNPLRTVLKYLVFLLVSMVVAHTFLAYFVGVDALAQWVRRSPFEHPVPFMIMAATTAAMMFNFSYFREQTCIVACPYGRLQSVLIDRNSLVISYDTRRGEPRGPVRKEPAAEPRGDCIDCNLCVATCPTGIDIRGGLQMECIGCAQCIDACDAVMDKLKRPRGLIRYTSQTRLAGDKSRLLRPRVVLYPLVLVVIAGLFGFVLERKSTIDVTLLRGLGSPFTVTAYGQVANRARLKLTNRTDVPADYRVDVSPDVPVQIVMEENPVTVAPGDTYTDNMMLIVPAGAFQQGHRDIEVRIWQADTLLRKVTYRLLGPQGSPTTTTTRAE